MVIPILCSHMSPILQTLSHTQNIGFRLPRRGIQLIQRYTFLRWSWQGTCWKTQILRRILPTNVRSTDTTYVSFAWHMNVSSSNIIILLLDLIYTATPNPTPVPQTTIPSKNPTNERKINWHYIAFARHMNVSSSNIIILLLDLIYTATPNQTPVPTANPSKNPTNERKINWHYIAIAWHMNVSSSNIIILLLDNIYIQPRLTQPLFQRQILRRILPMNVRSIDITLLLHDIWTYHHLTL